MSELRPFPELAASDDAPMDLLALALAAEFRELDAASAIAMLDGLGEELTRALAPTDGTPVQTALACAQLLGSARGFAGDRDRYDAPENSMLDLVLSRRRGLPILLSVVYAEVARRAGIPLFGVGLPGHFVVGHFAADPPVLLDPFNGGVIIDVDVPPVLLRPWRSSEIAMRMLNNLVAAFERRGDVAAALHGAAMRLMLPSDASLRDTLQAELRALQARLN